VAAVQYTFTYKRYTDYRELNINNSKKERKENVGNCGLCPVFASYTLTFDLQPSKKHGNPSIRVVEKCPEIPVAAGQYI
jgi:hypothetical protein